MPLLSGAIVMWSGTVEEIPAGWTLCDGQNNTIDLRNRFVVCAGDLYAVGNTGGSADATLVTHNHTGSTNTVGGHTHSFGINPDDGMNFGGTRGAAGGPGGFGLISNSAGSHSHTVSVTTVGESATGKNLPPYYALAFIQQVE
jgi:microcystin-dependent protein